MAMVLDVPWEWEAWYCSSPRRVDWLEPKDLEWLQAPPGPGAIRIQQICGSWRYRKTRVWRLITLVEVTGHLQGTPCRHGGSGEERCWLATLMSTLCTPTCMHAPPLMFFTYGWRTIIITWVCTEFEVVNNWYPWRQLESSSSYRLLQVQAKAILLSRYRLAVSRVSE